MYRNGNFWNGQARLYTILAADTNAYAIGDFVASTANADSNGLPAMTLATAGNPVRGVIVALSSAIPMGGVLQGGPYINPANLTQLTRPAAAQATNWYAAVVDDPDVVFEIQEVYSGSPLGATSMNKNANFVYAAPAAGSNLSGTTLNNVGVATTATLNLRLLGAAQRIDNVPYTLGQRFWVAINAHEFSGGTAGV
jgi:hypothetical protein